MTTHNISITQDMRKRSKEEQAAYDHPGHFHEYVFNQKLAKFHWEIFEVILAGAEEGPTDLSVNNPLLILAPRNHAKTTNFAESYPLWVAGRNPSTILCQIICSTITVAKKRLSRIKSCIESNSRYKELFGSLKPIDRDAQWTLEQIELKRDKSLSWLEGTEERDPSFMAVGITTNVEGGRATLQVYDDVVTFENSKTELGRKSVSEKFWTSFDPMLLPGGQSITLGTRYHYDDLYSELIRKFDTEGLYADMYSEEEWEDEE
jgi:hypothetical protein